MKNSQVVNFPIFCDFSWRVDEYKLVMNVYMLTPWVFLSFVTDMK